MGSEMCIRDRHMCIRVSTYTYVCVQLSIYTCVYKSHMSLAERHHTFSRENKLVHSICSLPWNNNLAQCIFDPAAMECLCISSNYLRAKLRCKRSIRSYCKQAVQHCRISEAIASRLCSTAGCNLMRHQTGDINAYQVDQVCLSRDINATTPGNLLGAASCSVLSASSR